MRDWQKIYVYFTGLIIVFIIIFSVIYLSNPSLPLYDYILFSVNILLIMITLILGMLKGFFAGIMVLLGYGIFLIYLFNDDFNKQSDIQFYSWFLIYPLSVYISGKISLLFKNMIKSGTEENIIGFDYETGLYNTKSFYMKLSEEIARVKMDKSNLFLALIKIKYFKELRSIYGKDVNGQVLSKIKDNLIKKTDLFEFKARLGEDCFGIIIPAIDEELVDVKKRLHETLKKHKIHLKKADKYINIEMQIGVGEYVSGENGLEFKERVEKNISFDIS